MAIDTVIQGQISGALDTPYTIYLLSGNYTITKTLVFKRTVTIYGRGYNSTFMQQQVNNPTMSGIMTVNDEMTLTLSHITFQNGNANAVNAASGGVVKVYPGNTLNIYDSRLRANVATVDGGAIYSFGPVNVARTLFLGNSVSNNGGAMSFNGGGPLTADCTRFESNNGNLGGAIIMYWGGNGITISNDSSFVNNNANSGSAVQNHVYNAASTVADARNTWWATPSVTAQTNNNNVNTTSQLTSDPGVCATNPPPTLPPNPNPVLTPTPVAVSTSTPTSTPIGCADALQVEGLNTTFCQGAPTPTRTPTPTSTPQSISCQYSIQILNVGTASWSQNELEALASGIDETAQALTLEAGLTAGCQGDQDEVFNRVFVSGDTIPEIRFIRANEANDSVTVPGFSVPFLVDQGYCKTFNGTGNQVTQNPAPRIIICNGFLLDNNNNGEASEYTIVHELGHIFDNRGARNNGRSISARLGLNGGLTRNILDCNDFVILGQTESESWTRGERGWGSGPSKTPQNTAYISPFQQNPRFVNGLDADEIYEAAADMFLNWVYRKNTYQAPQTDICSISITTGGNWSGFLNLSWVQLTQEVGLPPLLGTVDVSHPGDKRWAWMNSVVASVFIQQDW